MTFQVEEVIGKKKGDNQVQAKPGTKPEEDDFVRLPKSGRKIRTMNASKCTTFILKRT